jgi:probable HAF family extracellular repeat protein
MRSNPVVQPYCATEWSHGHVINLGGLPGYTNSFAYGINDSGQAVGYSLFVSGGFGVDYATEWSHGRVIDLGGSGSIALGINDAGQVVGDSTVSGATVATEWVDGHAIDLGGLPGSTTSVALGINNAGQIVARRRRPPRLGVRPPAGRCGQLRCRNASLQTMRSQTWSSISAITLDDVNDCQSGEAPS